MGGHLAQRIAMRSNGTLYFLFGDHLGSTSLVTFGNGNVVSETRYKAWGEVRYASGDTPTKYSFAGQYSYAADFGLMFYGARWYDSSLSRFTQADSITPRGIQGLDRYAYGNNSPIRYSDPSGHRPCDDEYGCYGGSYNSASLDGCSVSTGAFNGSFTCTAMNLNAATIAQRKGWFNGMLTSKASLDPNLPSQFNNINGILDVFISCQGS